MKLATLRRAGASDNTFAALITEKHFTELEGFADVGAFLAADPEARTAALGNAAALIGAAGLFLAPTDSKEPSCS